MTETAITPMSADELVGPAADPREANLAPPNIFGATTHAGILRHAYAVAQPLSKMVKDRDLSVEIKGRQFVKVEGWTACGAMCGVHPVVTETNEISHRVYSPEGEALDEPWGFSATVEARTMAGDVVGRAEAMCTRQERTWQNRDDYALLAMAQTRATSRALRGPLGFIMVLGGYQATAAEEMPRDDEA